MLIMTGEEEEGTPTHSHRRRWSTPNPIDPGGESHQNFTVGSLEIKSDQEDRGVSLEKYFSCSSDNSYSFYLGGKISPPSRSKAPQKTTEGRGRRSAARKRDLPPFMTTLDCNGRRRFNHRRVRSEGRLEIASVAVELPEIVSVRGREGLRIGTVRISKQDEDEDEEAGDSMMDDHY